MDKPRDESLQEDAPEVPSVSIAISHEEMPVPRIFASKNSPPTCHVVHEVVKVQIPSTSAGGIVEARVEAADPKTRLCYVTYEARGQGKRKWISFDETNPRLAVIANPSPEHSAGPAESVDEIVTQTRNQVDVTNVPRTVAIKGIVLPYSHDAYPRIQHVLHLMEPISAKVHNKTEGCDVPVLIDMVTEDLQACHITYSGKSEWISVNDVQPPLLLRKEEDEHEENKPQ